MASTDLVMMLILRPAGRPQDAAEKDNREAANHDQSHVSCSLLWMPGVRKCLFLRIPQRVAEWASGSTKRFTTGTCGATVIPGFHSRTSEMNRRSGTGCALLLACLAGPLSRAQNAPSTAPPAPPPSSSAGPTLAQGM